LAYLRNDDYFLYYRNFNLNNFWATYFKLNNFMKKILIIAFTLLLQSCLIGSGENSKIEASNNNYFPKVVGIDLQGNKQELPQAFQNKFNLVVVAFKREQQLQVDTWIKALEPILKEKSNLSFFEIPLIYELSSAKRFWVNNGMRFGILDEVARKRTITVYTNRDEFFKITKMREDEIYTLLLDKNGKILWRVEGVADDKKIKSLLDKMA